MNEITVANVTTALIEYKGQPVCTTRQLADLYGCADKNLTDNFQNNAGRFEEGKHFIRIDGNAFRSFKDRLPDEIGEPLKFAPKAILWTEKGAARHAKMLSTDKAWEVFEQLEDVYFRAKHESPNLLRHARPLSRNQVAAGILLLRSAAEDLNLAPSAVLGGYQKLEAQLGVTGLLPNYATDAPSDSATGSSEVAKPVGQLLEEFGVSMSAVAFNRLLVQSGFLEEVERKSTNGMKKYKSVANRTYGKNATHPSNQKETQPLWYASKFKELLELVLPPKPEAVA